MNLDTKDPNFEALLDYLLRTRGFDFKSYKRTTLMRRVAQRMQMAGVEGFGDYLDYIEVHTEEFTRLFNAILINVTTFYRDPQAWDSLSQVIIPRILADKGKDDPIRIWSAGCSSGEEAYTLVIVLIEAMGIGQFRQRMKIYATDVDEEALTQARRASYSVKDLEPVPAGLRDKYFEQVGNRYTFLTDLRRSVIFGRHDLLQDAPISRMDLLVCRNTLMYFHTEAQDRILSRFHFSLNDKGFLFLGKAEMILAHANLFTTADMKNRIFSKVPTVNLRDRMVVMAQAGDSAAADQPGQHVPLWEVAFDASPTAQIVVDRTSNLVLANEQARSLIGIALKDIGRPFQDLEVSYRPAELRSLIERVYAEGRPLALKDVKLPLLGGDVRHLDVQARTLQEKNGQSLGVSITFEDVTRYHIVNEELQHFKQELETANEELQSTNEELETTNEELQSTVEELQTTNEELQSTNEEMETMNEELQSTNEELQTLNDDLQRRTLDLNQVNTFLQSILSSVRVGIAVLGRDLNILSWNDRSTDLWGLRTDEVLGKDLLKLDIGLPVEQLQTPIQAILTGNENNRELVIEATNRRGKAIKCHITFTPSISPLGERQGVVLVMEEKL